MKSFFMSGPQYWWPQITDLESSKRAARNAVFAALTASVFTAVVTTMVMLGHKKSDYIDAWAYVDVALFALIGWRVSQYSRAFAIIGLVAFVVEKAYAIAAVGGGSLMVWLVNIILFFGFIGGARGVFAYHRYSSSATIVSPNENAPHAK